jgi:sugar phosphate isomerase/epimerase
MEPTLTYCTNVHPGETLAEVVASLERFAVPLARSLRPEPFAADRPFPLGLYLSAATARELGDAARLAKFREWLEQRSLSVATLNCFPYGGFHDERVKLDVYSPTWLEESRVEFTLAAARALVQLVPEGTVAPISTLAGSNKLFGDGDHVRGQIARQLARVAVELDRLRETTGREVVLCLEPEPFTTLETTDEAVRFFSDLLFGEVGRAAFVERGGDARRAEAALRRHVGVCFDTCHQAVEFEEAGAAVERLVDAGIRIGKVQLSSALRVREPAADPRRIAALAEYAEARWLHQTIARRRDGSLERWLDLPDWLALTREQTADVEEARVHFHVPIDRAAFGPLDTTQQFLVEAANAVRRRAATTVFEVETYTFPVLPAAAGPDESLVAGLAAELRFAAALLARAD